MRRGLLYLWVVLVLGGSAPARAQLVAMPESLAVSVAQQAEAERTLVLANTGEEAARFCLSFARPLQREAGGARLSQNAPGTACGELGEVLVEIDRMGLPGCCSDPYGLAMTPEGHLFAAERNEDETVELTPELEVVRSFEHPAVAELVPFPTTFGVTYNSDTGSLWWLNLEQRPSDNLRRALLLEGTLDGKATERRIELPVHRPEGDTLFPHGLSYDPATARYYMLGDFRDGRRTLWAVDTLGVPVDGYPTESEAYPFPALLGFGLDAHGGTAANGSSGEPEAVRIEFSPVPPGAPKLDRLAVMDAEGRDLGIPETPLPDVSGGTGFGSIQGSPLRSRLDPNGVLYFPFVNFDTYGIVGIRPHPLPPSWLSVSQWNGTLGPGESVEVVLTFSSGTRAVGNTYTAELQVFEAETGNAIEVPLSFEVVPETTAEDGAEVPAAASLQVFPNPSVGRATVVLALSRGQQVEVVVYDVLGRQVAVLANGLLTAGTHRFRLDAARLPAGVYLVRMEAGLDSSEQALSQRFTLVR